MKNSFVSVLVAGFLAAVVVSECPNACSAHGRCGAYDMCTCYRNWMSNDCSERICQFGLAHVDTPKGDLDSSSGKLSDADTVVITNDAMYPYGTTEQYPFVGDIDGNQLTDTAHEYRECSNKGICDRETGTCACFEGYDGSACQRASCPITDGQMCAGHGTCHTIEELSRMDFNNIYELWDSSSTMGCKCDAGYSGADCSERVCKWGTDPLYFDSGATGRYANWTYQFYTEDSADNDATETVTGNYSIIFYDAHGEDWQTDPIDIGADCTDIVAALEGIPNDVIPAGTVRCWKETINKAVTKGFKTATSPIVDSTNVLLHAKYIVAFPGNPGALKPIEINKYLDGARPTLNSNEAVSTLGWHIFPNGFTGEDVDMVPDLCEGVLVQVASGGTGDHYLTEITVQEAKALKRCLGSSDSTDDNNVEVYNWDYGSAFNPHLIKLVDQTQYTTTTTQQYDGAADLNTDAGAAITPSNHICHPNAINAELYDDGMCSNKNPSGFFVVMWYDSGNSNPWRLYNNPSAHHAASDNTQFKVYTTKGYLQLVNPYSAVYTTMEQYTAKQMADNMHTNVLHVTNTTGSIAGDWMGWMDCETQTIGTNGALACLNKNDYVMFLSGNGTDPIYPNMYQITKLSRNEKNYGNLPQMADPQRSGEWNVNSDKIRSTITLNMAVNHKMHYKNSGFDGDVDDTIARVYKFYPDTTSPTWGYAYAGECSHRGVCNQDNGLCECFSGYTNDNCNSINALAQ
jgi:hypothetical protein